MATPRSKLTIIIFGLVGVFNTLFDFALYYVLFRITGSIIIANIASTSAALVGSYLINSKLTFKSKDWTARSFFAFVGVTVFGLWVLQTGAIYLISRHLNLVPQELWRLAGPLKQTAMDLAPKVLATAVTLVWNYLWYSRVIFKDDGKQTQVLATIDEL